MFINTTIVATRYQSSSIRVTLFIDKDLATSNLPLHLEIADRLQQ